VPQELVTDCDVLILGGSMAGIELVHQLRRSPAGRTLRIVVIDRQAVHGYIPLAPERLWRRRSRWRTPDTGMCSAK
jgi:NADH dehydrogenase FAD-containing subunit